MEADECRKDLRDKSSISDERLELRFRDCNVPRGSPRVRRASSKACRTLGPSVFLSIREFNLLNVAIPLFSFDLNSVIAMPCSLFVVSICSFQILKNTKVIALGKAVTTNCACLSRMTSPQALRRVNYTPYRGNKAEPPGPEQLDSNCKLRMLSRRTSPQALRSANSTPYRGNKAGYERGARSGDGATGHGGGNPGLAPGHVTATGPVGHRGGAGPPSSRPSAVGGRRPGWKLAAPQLRSRRGEIMGCH